MLERHLMQVVLAVESACASAKSQTAAAMASTVVDAFVGAKFANLAALRALYSVAAEVEGASVVAQLTQRSQLALCDMLTAASDRIYRDLTDLSNVLSTAVIGRIQGSLATKASAQSVRVIQSQLTLMVSAYLQATGAPKRSTNRRI